MAIVLRPRLGGSSHTGLASFQSEGGFTLLGRVIDVVLNDKHREWSRRGHSLSLYGVLYQNMFVGENDDPKTNPSMGFAYCGDPNFRRIPIKNEIVTIVLRTSAEWSEELQTNANVTKAYWTGIVPVWNIPNVNPYPDTVKYSGPADLGKDFKEDEKIMPLALGPGDMSLEGRYGNTIRLGGTKTDNSPIASADTSGKPYTIIRNGQGTSGEYFVKEDINKDGSSIYLTSDHKVPLTQARTKYDARKSSKSPEKSTEYKGAQIVMNSDRLWFNSKKYDIELTAKEALGISAKVVSLDGTEYVAFDASKIYLGTAAFSESQPVLLGKMSTNWLSNLCQILENLLQVMSTVTPSTVSSLAGAAAAAMVPVTTLKQSLNTLLSKKVYTQ